MTKTLRVDLADLEGIPHASGSSGTRVVVTAEYTSPVILASDGTIILAPKSKTMGAAGRVDFDGIYASDSEDVREDHRGFAVRVKVEIREPNGATRTWSRTVKPLENMTATIQLGQLPSAEGLPPKWATVGEVIGDFDSRLGVVEVATGTQYGNVPTLTNVTEIPTDVSGRIDLVYTQPTTVHFDAPGLTDIVVSIEGYEHVTWEGVAVHGTPTPSGVVWASALWRDRDYTWHLMCEQDASSAGGGNVRLHQWTSPFEAVRDKSPQVLDSRGFVQQEAYAPIPIDRTYGDAVVDLDNPTGGAPIVSYVNVPVMSSASSMPAAFSPVSTAEAVFRTPDNSSYLKFTVTNCRIRGDIYVLEYTVKVKGSPFRVDTFEQFDHPMLAALVAPGCGEFVLVDRFDIPGFSPSGATRPSLTISRPPDPASQAPYIRVTVPAAPTTSFATEVTVTRSIEGHLGSGRKWSAT